MRTIIVLLALAGCAGSGSPAEPNLVGPEPPAPGPPPLSEEYRGIVEMIERPFREPGVVTARLNEEVRVGSVRVRPLAILEDTRCPIDVDCVHGGQIKVRVAIGGQGETELQLRQPLTVTGETIRLVAVAPPRWSRPPPAGIDANAPPRFGFRTGERD